MPSFYYVQQTGGKSDWKAIPSSSREVYIRENMPEFVTVLSVNKLVEDLSSDDKLKLNYEGPLYFDFDAPDIATTLPQVNKFLDKLVDLQLDLTSIRCFATGGKGFHIEIPQQCFMDRVPKQGVMYLPVIYREIAMELCVDTLDLRVYSQKRGRMWRVPNNLRANGTHKVPVTAQDIRSMTVESYAAAVSAPRGTIPVAPPQLCIDLAIVYSGAAQKIEDRMKAQSKFKRQPNDKLKAKSISIEMMMDGRGIKEGTGFHELALQIAIAATTSGMTEADMLKACEGLIESHVGDGGRYGSQERRRLELSRMFAYCDDNPCYGFSVGAVKSLLSHAAPDLDGLVVSEADITEGIVEAKEHDDAVAAGEVTPDEFADTSGGVTLSKFGVYIDTEFGKKRICAISFKEIHLLVSTETGQLSAYEAQVLVNGRETGRQTMELDTFSSVQMFNRFAARLGHALQGVETHIRGLMMRFVELAKKKGRMRYIAKREGLDLVNIPNHENPELRKPFMVWADTRGVILDPRLEAGVVDMSYQGFPEPHGLFRSDLADAPALKSWLEEDPNNLVELKQTLEDLFTCQRPEVIGKLLGWYTASIYRMLFHKAYGQFPVLHVNGSAGAGKTSTTKSLMALFFYNQEAPVLTPGSTLFSVQQHMSASASIPLLLDEYKPQDMSPDMHARYRLLIRDAYNCRTIAKGGGTRESDDYRSLHQTALAAPLVVIAEAAEEEAAVSERVVLVTFVKPASSMSNTWAQRYHRWARNGKHLTILGQWLVTQAIQTSSLDALREEFDPLYADARKLYLLNAGDETKGLAADKLLSKQNAKERSVFNFTVARFGLLKFRNLVETVCGDAKFKAKFTEMEAGIYERMSDLQGSTQAEWAKVLNMMSTMSYEDPDQASTLRNKKDYAFINVGGLDCIEISMRSVYLKYRSFCRFNNSKALFAGDQSFLQAIRDCPAFVTIRPGDVIEAPNAYVFRSNDLVALGVEIFKGA